MKPKTLSKNLCVLSIITALLTLDIWAQGVPAKDLRTGNKWIYWHTETGQPGYASWEIVTGDTVINEKVYAKVSDKYNSTVFERADSSKIYCIEPGYITERIQCDFHVNVGDTVWHGEGASYSLVTSVHTDTFWGCQRTFVGLYYEFSYLYSEHTTFAEGIGMVSLSAAGLAVQDFEIEIRGAVLNSVAYGDTIIPKSRVEIPSSGPGSFQLYQNYPNPFNGTTLISFDIEKPGPVTLKVFDMTGRLVDVLFQSWCDAGNYKIFWSPRGFPSGVYLCRLEAANVILTKKLLYSK